MADNAFERAEERVVASHRPEVETPGAYQGSVSTANDYEKTQHEPASKDLTRVRSGMSVEQAEADFQELQRELTGISRASRRSSRRPADPEKNALDNSNSNSDDGSSLFDLETALRGDLDSQNDTGIKGKHISAYWDGLTVKGFGGRANYMSTFPDSFVNFFDYITLVINLLGLGKKPVKATLL